jgi:hypothetical protein
LSVAQPYPSGIAALTSHAVSSHVDAAAAIKTEEKYAHLAVLVDRARGRGRACRRGRGESSHQEVEQEPPGGIPEVISDNVRGGARGRGRPRARARVCGRGKSSQQEGEQDPLGGIPEFMDSSSAKPIKSTLIGPFFN